MTSQLQAFKAQFFRTLGHPVRIRILEILVRGEHTVQEMQEVLSLDQPIVSQHLAILRNHRIVSAQKHGQTVRYSLRYPAIAELLGVAKRIVANHLNDSQVMLRELKREARR